MPNKSKKSKTVKKSKKYKPKSRSSNKNSNSKKSKTKSRMNNQKGGFKKYDFNSNDRPIKLIPEDASLRKIFKESGVGNPPKISCNIL